jgi:hypothetical protein
VLGPLALFKGLRLFSFKDIQTIAPLEADESRISSKKGKHKLILLHLIAGVCLVLKRVILFNILLMVNGI